LIRFLLRRILLPLWVLLALCLPSAPLLADDETKLEEWQRRVLRALERDADRQSGGNRQSLRAPGSPDPGEARAAAEAQARHGGRALAVVRVRDGYKVRLLLDNGRVVTVMIRD